ncbi:MAG: DUF2513 domain-containing protein [Vicinamibacterales bacterium]
MTRDFDLIRKLLVYFDEKLDYTYTPVPSMGPEYTDDQVTYHCLLMYQAGLLDAEPESSKTGRVIRVRPFGLTWDGHEFLGKIRDDSRWQRIKTIAVQKTGSLSFAALTEVAKRLAIDALTGSPPMGTI